MKCILIACVVALALCVPTSGQPITRSDLALGSTNITFNTLPNAIAVGVQYRPDGADFSGTGGAPLIDNTNAQFYGPLANGNILRATGSNIMLRFVTPGGGQGTTAAVGADIIFRETGQTTTLNVFSATDVLLGSVITPPDMGLGDEVFLGYAAPGIAYAVFVFDSRDLYVGIDNAAFGSIPSPGGAPFLAAGLVLMGWRRRLRRVSTHPRTTRRGSRRCAGR
jgi:hypothetical protein